MYKTLINASFAAVLFVCSPTPFPAFGQATISITGDCSGSGSSTINVTCTKSGGVNLGALATQSSVLASQLPALTGDVTSAAGSAATTISQAAITYLKVAPGVASLQCVNPQYYGWSPTASGATNQMAMNAAIATGRNICISEGEFHTAGSFTPLGGVPGQRVYGSGRQSTTIINESSDQPTFVVTDWAVGIEISDLAVTRNVSAVSGGDGIVTGAATNHIAVRRVYSTKNFNGFRFGATAWADSDSNISDQNNGDGFAILTGNFSDPDINVNAGGLQWNFIGQNLSQNNMGWGYRYDSTGTCPSSGHWQVTLGPINSLYSFNNTMGGVSFSGTANCPMQDIQMQGGFLGSDGNNEIYISSFGTYAAINNTTIELAGLKTGVQAAAINIQSNATGPVRISGVDISSSNGQGIVSGADNTVVTNSKVNYSGQAITISPNITSSGITLNGSYSMIIGGQTIGAQYGAQVNGTGSAIIGLDAHDNSVSGINGVADSTVIPANVASGAAQIPYVINFTAPPVTAPKPVAGLGACTASNVGARGAASDSTATLSSTSVGSAVVGGGGQMVPVYCDGSNWRIG